MHVVKNQESGHIHYMGDYEECQYIRRTLNTEYQTDAHIVEEYDTAKEWAW